MLRDDSSEDEREAPVSRETSDGRQRAGKAPTRADPALGGAAATHDEAGTLADYETDSGRGASPPPPRPPGTAPATSIPNPEFPISLRSLTRNEGYEMRRLLARRERVVLRQVVPHDLLGRLRK